MHTRIDPPLLSDQSRHGPQPNDDGWNRAAERPSRPRA